MNRRRIALVALLAGSLAGCAAAPQDTAQPTSAPTPTAQVIYVTPPPTVAPTPVAGMPWQSFLALIGPDETAIGDDTTAYQLGYDLEQSYLDLRSVTPQPCYQQEYSDLLNGTKDEIDGLTSDNTALINKGIALVNKATAELKSTDATCSLATS